MKNLQENLKYFYMGINNDEPYLYKNKDLTTHMAIIGMTGSGKTGLGISILEEACIDNIPSIIIDPKGDLTNLLLSFENLKSDDFLPYVDENEANTKGLSKQEMAENLAKDWQEGIASSGQDISRIKLFKDSANFRIFTPKSSAGIGVSLLSDFISPKNLDDEALNSYILNITNSLFALIGLNNLEPTSKEVVLLQNIFLHNFKENKNLSIADLISQIAKPTFEKVGVFDVESFFASDKRMELAMKINAFIANPSFNMWCKGQRLDIAKLLFDENGKAGCNIFTISHLNDEERMFFVTTLLNEIINWMRTTQGTSSLRAILYMDEIFGYFPPNSNPPSKMPMLTLLKQARAFGLGCILSTQNPVDLDYKAMSNIGTWCIGRLQTAQDKQRVISGLSGISGSQYSDDELLDLLSNLKKRNFLIKNINEDGLKVISTRFCLSYLKGPLSNEQISNLMANLKENEPSKTLDISNVKPVLSSEIPQLYSYQNGDTLSPWLMASAKIRYFNKEFDVTKDVNYFLNLDCLSEIDWNEASENLQISTTNEEKDGLKFASLPSFISNLKDFKDTQKEFKEFLYRNQKLEIYSALDLNSNPDESKESFILRLQDKCNEILEEETAKIEEKFKKESEKLNLKISNANEKFQKEQDDVASSGMDAILGIGSVIMGAIFGKSKMSANKISTSAKKATKILDARKDVEYAKQDLDELNAMLANLNEEFQNKVSELKQNYDVKQIQIQTKQISPKKSDIYDEKVSLLWKS